jgi:hypothetical protein
MAQALGVNLDRVPIKLLAKEGKDTTAQGQKDKADDDARLVSLLAGAAQSA